MPRSGESSEPLKKYHAEPPQWLSTAHSSADLGMFAYSNSYPPGMANEFWSNPGFHGFFPLRPDQPEDLLSDSNVKHGYSATHTMGVCLANF